MGCYTKGDQIKSLLPKINITRHGYYNVNWASDIDRKKSTFGYVFILSLKVASWTQKRKTTIV